MATNVENNSQLDVRDLNPAELVDSDVAQKVDLSNVTDELPADEETLNNVNSLRKEGNEFIKVIDSNKELSDMVKKLFPNTYKFAVKSIKRFEKAKGEKMTNREVKQRLNGLINSLTPIINYVLAKLRDPKTLEKIKFIETKLENVVVILKKSGFVGENMNLSNYDTVEEISVSELAEEELGEIEKNPALEGLSKALKKDIVRDIVRMRKLLKDSRKMNKAERAKIEKEVAWKVDGIINLVDNVSHSKVVEYAAQVPHLIKKLGAVKSLLRNNVQNESELIGEKTVDGEDWVSEKIDQ